MHTLKAMPRPVPEQISGLRRDSPHSIALSHLGRRMTYEELDRSADQFASRLAKKEKAPKATESPEAPAPDAAQ